MLRFLNHCTINNGDDNCDSLSTPSLPIKNGSVGNQITLRTGNGHSNKNTGGQTKGIQKVGFDSGSISPVLDGVAGGPILQLRPPFRRKCRRCCLVPGRK